MTRTQTAAAALDTARAALAATVATAEVSTGRSRRAAWAAVEVAESARDFARADLERAVRAAAAGTLTEAEVQDAVRAA